MTIVKLNKVKAYPEYRYKIEETMVEVFKTSVQVEEQAKMLLSLLLSEFTFSKVNFDLTDCDRILRIEGENIPNENIIELLAERGYHCEVLI